MQTNYLQKGAGMWPADFIPYYHHEPISDGAICLAFIGDQLLVCPDGRLPGASVLPGQESAEISVHFGSQGDQKYILQAWPQGTLFAEPLLALGLRAAWGLVDDAIYWIAARAQQLLTFDRQHRFCGCCGTATRRMPQETARECPACLHRAYPRISPAIMVLIRRGRQLLLARSPHFKPGVYSAVAGFIEAGENAEQAAHREVYEEVGVKVGELRWFGSQSHPFPHSLMLAFMADYISGEVVAEEGEIEDARWFDPENLPEMPGKASIAYHLMQAGLSLIADEEAAQQVFPAK